MNKVIAVRKKRKSALDLMHSSLAWDSFYKKDFETPQELIKNILEDSIYSKATIVSNYFKYHEEKRNERSWLNVVNASLLLENDSQWNVFFNQKYESPLELLNAIPHGNTKSVVTVTAYYFTFYPERSEASSWKTFMSALVFVNNNLDAGLALLSDRVSVDDIKDRVPLEIKSKTIKKYMQYLGLFGVTDTNIKNILRLM